MAARDSAAVPLLALLALVNCDADADDEGGESTAGPASDCSTETRDDTYTLGLTKTGAHVKVRFVDAVPAPPERFDNTWTVEVLGDGDLPLSDVEIDVTPYMPDHEHGTSVVAHVEPGTNPGEYVLDPVNLHMPGLWEVTLDLTLPDMTTDSVMFAFCIDP